MRGFVDIEFAIEQIDEYRSLRQRRGLVEDAKKMSLKVSAPLECFNLPTFVREGNGECRAKPVAEAYASLKRGLSGE